MKKLMITLVLLLCLCWAGCALASDESGGIAPYVAAGNTESRGGIVKGTKVTFDANGGVFANGSDQFVTVTIGGYMMRKPGDPSKKIILSQPTSTEYSYVFGGWYLVTNGVMADTPFDINTRIDKDITLKAKWDKVIAFDANCADYEGATASIRLDESVDDYILPVCGYTRVGYAFIGWGSAPQVEAENLKQAGEGAASKVGVTWYAQCGNFRQQH